MHDAEDLTQDTLLAAHQYLYRGGEITNMKYWLTSTLSHKWNDKLRQKYKLPTVSIDMIADDIEDDVNVDGPTAEEVRREVAYLAKLQREVIVRHYLQGEKVQTIADELGVPKGTVLSRLSSGREQMRKGFEEMENYNRQSYKPEHLDVSCHGCPGFHDEPWSLVANDKMKQNILIAAYEKPVTVVEISKALGIPTAYVESAVNDLLKSELMASVGNDVFTDILNCISTKDVITAEVSALHKFPDFEELYKALPLEKCGYTVAEPDILKLLASSVYNPTEERLLNRAKKYQDNKNAFVYGFKHNGKYKGIIVF